MMQYYWQCRGGFTAEGWDMPFAVLANGEQASRRRDVPATTLRFQLSHNDWQARLRRNDIVIEGLEPCRAILGLA